jgi:spore coat protein U-like protein
MYTDNRSTFDHSTPTKRNTIMKFNRATLAIGLLAALAATPAAFAAGSITGNLSVKATVVASCVLNTAAPGAGNGLLDFGNVTSTATNVDVDTVTGSNYSVNVQCSNALPYSVTADYGQHGNGTQRRMSNGTEFLPYNLYTGSDHATAVPNSGATWAFTGNGSGQSIPVYGRIPAGTALPTAGLYTDTVVLTTAF